MTATEPPLPPYVTDLPSGPMFRVIEAMQGGAELWVFRRGKTLMATVGWHVVRVAVIAGPIDRRLVVEVESGDMKSRYVLTASGRAARR